MTKRRHDPFTLTSILSHQWRGGKRIRTCRDGGVFSYQSRLLTGAGTPRCENLRCELAEVSSMFIFLPITHPGWHRHTKGLKMVSLDGRKWGAIRAIPATPLDSGLRRNDERGAGATSAGAEICRHRRPCNVIPDRGPGHAFVPIIQPGLRRHTRVGKWSRLRDLIPGDARHHWHPSGFRPSAEWWNSWAGVHPGSESGTWLHAKVG